MLVIPTINCKNFKCVKERLEMAAEFLPRITDNNERKFGSGKSKNNMRKSVLRGLPKIKNKRWVQIDISDGKFTKAKSWNDSKKFKILNLKFKINTEVHLMVKNPEYWAEKWFDAGASRVIIHFEALNKAKSEERIANSGKIGIAIKTETEIEKIIPYLDKIKFIQLLAVKAGYSGQNFDKKVLKKIKFLKKNHPKIIIEIDGGVDLKTAKLVKAAGADIVVSGSYIFESKNPKEAYQRLSSI